MDAWSINWDDDSEFIEKQLCPSFQIRCSSDRWQNATRVIGRIRQAGFQAWIWPSSLLPQQFQCRLHFHFSFTFPSDSERLHWLLAKMPHEYCWKKSTRLLPACIWLYKKTPFPYDDIITFIFSSKTSWLTFHRVDRKKNYFLICQSIPRNPQTAKMSYEPGVLVRRQQREYPQVRIFQGKKSN